MLKNIFIQLYFFFTYLLGYGQTAEIVRSDFIPEVLKETSGLLYYPPNSLVQINDSGNPPEIIVSDTLGNLLQLYCLPGAVNVDWEDLASDEEYIYIGDFGNNLNRRKDLMVYKVETDKVLKGDDSFTMEEIHFRYEDQHGFPPDRNRRNFDMEAMIHLNDHLYLFSKNRTQPFDGYTYCYRIPDTAGTFIAEKVDSFRTGRGIKESFWITAADFREVPRQLILLGYDKLWLFYNFTEDKFFSGKHLVLYFNSVTQKESVTFLNEDRIIVSDEKNTRKDGKIYTVKIPETIVKADGADLVQNLKAETVSPRIDAELELKIALDEFCKVRWEAYNGEGQRLHEGNFEADPERNIYSIDTSEWKSGTYEIHLYCNRGMKILKVDKY